MIIGKLIFVGQIYWGPSSIDDSSDVMSYLFFFTFWTAWIIIANPSASMGHVDEVFSFYSLGWDREVLLVPVTILIPSIKVLPSEEVGGWNIGIWEKRPPFRGTGVGTGTATGSFPFPAFAGEAYGVREVSGTTVRLSLIWFTTACKWLTSSLVIEGWAPTFFTVKGKVEDRREVGLPKPRTSKAYPSKP